MDLDHNREDVAHLINVRISSVTEPARDIKVYRLESLDGTPLPPAGAGAHIDLFLPNGLVRQYSLILKDFETASFTIAVKRDAASRGGSTYIYDNFRIGDLVKIGPPRNNFPLEENASHSLLIAGGIGITPIFSMVHRLHKLNKSWELHYACRSRLDAAFRDELPAGQPSHVHLDDESAGKFLDLGQIIRSAPPEAHLYCCGPLPMIAAFDEAAAAISDQYKHVEYFTPKEAPSQEGGFIVKLARQGITVSVPPGRTILQALTEAGISASYSCSEGICGACETTVLAGIPDHRDSVLMPDEQATNKVMMICCSGSKTEEIVLDL